MAETDHTSPRPSEMKTVLANVSVGDTLQLALEREQTVVGRVSDIDTRMTNDPRDDERKLVLDNETPVYIQTLTYGGIGPFGDDIENVWVVNDD